MELLSEVRPGFGSAVRYYWRSESAWVYWERWEWRAPEPPERKMLLVWWFTPFGVIVGLMTLFIALLGGAVGKSANCQVNVQVAITDGLVAVPVGARLYLPESWTQDRSRCRRIGERAGIIGRGVELGGAQSCAIHDR